MDDGAALVPDEPADPAYDLALAKCRWPCDQPGCTQDNPDSPGQQRCALACQEDANCPSGSVCACSEAGCSLHPRMLADGNVKEHSCWKLLPHQREALEACRLKKGTCSLSPQAGAKRAP